MKLNKMVFDDKKIEEAARLDDKEYYDRLSDIGEYEDLINSKD